MDRMETKKKVAHFRSRCTISCSCRYLTSDSIDLGKGTHKGTKRSCHYVPDDENHVHLGKLALLHNPLEKLAVSETQSRSLESTTKMIPWAFLEICQANVNIVESQVRGLLR